ncbi:SpcZ [Streptomyces bauhiniae]|uniref:SpcZ n=1 Tax=Streptomyces bauhiniae TaxID=2340725 RepID=UPI0035E0F367
MSPSLAATEPSDRLLARLEAGMTAAGPVPDLGLPGWLWQVSAVLHDGLDGSVARDWVLRLHGALARLAGPVPFDVVHDWQARTVAPMLVEACIRRDHPAGPQEAVRELHLRALAGERVTAAEWEAALEPALRVAHRLAYAYADAFTDAYAGAHAYAVANDYGAERAAEFAGSYAESNTGANAASFAEGVEEVGGELPSGADRPAVEGDARLPCRPADRSGVRVAQQQESGGGRDVSGDRSSRVRRHRTRGRLLGRGGGRRPGSVRPGVG